MRFRKVVYDIEVLKNLFTVTFLDLKDKSFKQFVIHELRNDYFDLLIYLDEIYLSIGYNNLRYDYPVIHHLINHRSDYMNMDINKFVQCIYDKSQKVIESDFSIVADKNQKFKQVDLYELLNLSSDYTSLKKCEVGMRLKNVEEMPIKYYQVVHKVEDIDKILSYNKLDVFATYKLLQHANGISENEVYKGFNAYKLREHLSDRFSINLLSKSDIDLGQSIFTKFYALSIGKTEYEVRGISGTPREYIDLKQCIPGYIKFHNSGFNSLKKEIENKTITSTSGSFKKDIIFDGIKLSYGLGGLHASRSGLFESSKTHIIIDLDVFSYYPSIMVKNSYFPYHLGINFCNVLDGIINARSKEGYKPKEDQSQELIFAYKKALNSSYGKTNYQKSFTYDPLITMKTTITGQLSISMLIDSIFHSISDSKLLQINSDGLTLIIPKNKESDLNNIIKQWEIITKLKLKIKHYSKMAIRDVNNYYALDFNGESKLTGCFKIHRSLSENPSMIIVSKALYEFFTNGIPVSETINNCKDIFDFCLLAEIKKPYTGRITYHDKTIDLDRTNRYYISKTGGKLSKYKKLENNICKEEGIRVGSLVTLFNKFEEKEFNEYNIDYLFYISECNKIIDKIIPKQLTLW